MIKICFHELYLCRGGGIHHLKNILKYIDRSKFEPFLCTVKAPSVATYFNEVTKYIEPNHILLYQKNPCQDYNTKIGGYPPPCKTHPVYDFLNNNKIDILCTSVDGIDEFPLNSLNISCKKIQTNIFAGISVNPCPDKILCISQCVYNDWSEKMEKINKSFLSRGEILGHAIDYPCTDLNMRTELGISEKIVVFGRSGNSYAGDVLNIEAYSRVENENTLLLFLFPTNVQREIVKKNKIKNCIFLDPIDSYYEMSKFYNTLDILIHARAETFGCIVAEAMIHGKPVVSSWGGIRGPNAQGELIQDSRYNAEFDLGKYVKILNWFLSLSEKDKKEEERKFYQRIVGKYDARTIVSKLEKIYEEVLYG